MFRRICWVGILLLSALGVLLFVTPEPEVLESGPRGTIVNDVTAMNPVAVRKVAAPTSIAEIQKLLQENSGPISVGGGHFSMGGQTASEGTLHLDMRQMNRIIAIDKEAKRATVEAGITWHALIEALDPLGLSVKIMQSYSNFTVGGSLSVNVHGRYIGYGPIASSVESFKVVMADGSLVEASRSKNPEIFSGCLGGYGGLGVIAEVTLNLAENVPLKRELVVLPADGYREYFRNSVRDNRDIIFQNGDLIPNGYDQVYSVVWKKSDQELTEKRGVASPRVPSLLDRLLAFIVMDVPYGVTLRRYLEPLRYRGEDPVVWRNFEASYDVSDLAPIATPEWSFVLQEYFVPVAQFRQFAAEMGEILNRNNVEVGNLSIRHALPDPDSLLTWARQEVFAFVLYYRQPVDIVSRRHVGSWTRELVDTAIKHGGTYYLPYQPHALNSQFLKAYPAAPQFFALKQKLDPNYRFRNKLWDAYYRPDTKRKIMEATVPNPSYFRPEDQTFLTVPEWQLVFASEDLAAVTAQSGQANFPFFKAVAEFWKIYARVFKATVSLYPTNWGYHFMNCVIGINTSVEYLIKGAYEATIGKISADFAGGSAAAAESTLDAFISRTYHEYASFIHTEPWYKFPFKTLLSEFLTIPRGSEDSSFRYYERKLVFSAELFMKALLSKLFLAGTETLYGEEDLQIGAVVATDSTTAAAFFSPEQIKATVSENTVLVSVPRYQAFTDLVKRLTLDPLGERVAFVEIAGNERIVFSVIAPQEWYPSTTDAALVGELSLFSQPGRKRIIFSVLVKDLLTVTRRLEGKGIHLDHVFDY